MDDGSTPLHCFTLCNINIALGPPKRAHGSPFAIVGENGGAGDVDDLECARLWPQLPYGGAKVWRSR